MYINVGVKWAESGERPTYKKELMRAIRTAPETVVFDKTSPLDRSDLPATFGVDQLVQGMTLSVCGPSPYTKRDWFCSIERRADGTLVAR